MPGATKKLHSESSIAPTQDDPTTRPISWMSSVACRFATVKALPGARRLLGHLARQNIPIAVATSTSRDSFNAKMQAHTELRECVAAVVCSDDVEGGEAQGIFLKAAGLLSILPTQCIAFEDTPSGVQVSTCAILTS